MICKLMLFFGESHILACDARCDLAWGIQQRPRVQLSADPDDYAFLADAAVTWPAPVDPGTYEGTDGKPVDLECRLNRWCARECERSARVPIEMGNLIQLTLPDFSEDVRNLAAPAIVSLSEQTEVNQTGESQ